MLRLIVEHLQTLALAELRKADLTNAGRAVLALETEQARLHQVLERYLPPTPPVIRSSKPESHPERIVRRMRDYIEKDYAKTITLQGCADKFGMNAAYLSDLFSHAVGVPFKAYLTELRLQKARELLSDPTRNVSEVADAVGYAGENRLSPRTWRETFDAAGAFLLGWIVTDMEFLERVAGLALA